MSDEIPPLPTPPAPPPLGLVAPAAPAPDDADDADDDVDDVEAPAEDGADVSTDAYDDEDKTEVKQYACKNKPCKHKADVEWMGPCPLCRSWKGAAVHKKTVTSKSSTGISMQNFKLTPRVPTGLIGLDNVLGPNIGPGGVPQGKPGIKKNGVVLIGGRKGAGKSTALLQVGNGFAQGKRVAMMASDEQPTVDIQEYMYRMGIANNNFHVFGTGSGLGNAYTIIEKAEELGAKLVIVDSLQTAHCPDVKGDVGSAVQVNAVTNTLQTWAKKKRVALIVVCHLNKAGDFAGTETVTHLIDIMLSFERCYDLDDPYRTEYEKSLRIISIAEGKNRGGGTEGKAILAMTATGLHLVEDPPEDLTMSPAEMFARMEAEEAALEEEVAQRRRGRRPPRNEPQPQERVRGKPVPPDIPPRKPFVPRLVDIDEDGVVHDPPRPRK